RGLAVAHKVEASHGAQCWALPAGHAVMPATCWRLGDSGLIRISVAFIRLEAYAATLARLRWMRAILINIKHAPLSAQIDRSAALACPQSFLSFEAGRFCIC